MGNETERDGFVTMRWPVSVLVSLIMSFCTVTSCPFLPPFSLVVLAAEGTGC